MLDYSQIKPIYSKTRFTYISILWDELNFLLLFNKLLEFISRFVELREGIS